MKKTIILFTVLLLPFICLSVDRCQYFRGNSLVDYKFIPYGFRPDIRSNYWSGSDAAFVFTYNEHEQIGPGFSSADIGVCTIKRIISYYYNSSELIITCKLTDDDLIYIKPIKKDGDIKFIRARIQDIDVQNMHYIDCSEIHYWIHVHILRELL